MKRPFGVAVVICALLSASAAGAAPVTGTFHITGDEDLLVGEVEDPVTGATTSRFIDFGLFDENFGLDEPGDFTFNIGTGTFAGITGGGFISDIVDLPVGLPTALADFLTVDTMGDLEFTLTRLDTGVFPTADCFAPPAAGQICTPHDPPNLSPFNLANTSASAFFVSFSIRGFVVNADQEVSDFVALFSSPRTDIPFQVALQQVEDEGFFRAPWSADFAFTPRPREVPVPEPASTALMGLGMTAVAFAIRRRTRR